MAQDAGDYEDLFDLDNLDDQEIYDLILQELEEYPEIDPKLLEIEVRDGFITVGGRVGTEQELQEVDHVLSDVLGAANYSNEIVIQGTARQSHSEAGDEAAMEDREVEGPLGDAGSVTDPQADHLVEDLESDLYGTHDMQKAITRGESYEPPDRPVQEGTWSEETH